MGYMTVIGNCATCGILFSFNADWVPSFTFQDEREPICKDCMTRVNAVRVARGDEPFWIHPEAYEAQEVD